jgi:hypothetical protein
MFCTTTCPLTDLVIKYSSTLVFLGLRSNCGHLNRDYGLARKNNRGHFILNSLESLRLKDTIHPTKAHLYKTDLLFPFEYHTNEGDHVYESEA